MAKRLPVRLGKLLVLNSLKFFKADDILMGLKQEGIKALALIPSSIDLYLYYSEIELSNSALYFFAGIASADSGYFSVIAV